VSWRTETDDQGERLLLHANPTPPLDKMFALLGPYRMGGVIDPVSNGSQLVLYLSQAPGHAVHRASVSKLKILDADGGAVPVDKIDAEPGGGGRMGTLFGFIYLAVVNGAPEEIKRIHCVEGELKVAVPEDLQLQEFELSTTLLDKELPFQFVRGKLTINKPSVDTELNISVEMMGSKGQTVLLWAEDERHQLLFEFGAMTSEANTGTSHRSPVVARARWLVAGRVEKERETTYPFSCRRQKP
jgi:hypothetical protein